MPLGILPKRLRMLGTRWCYLHSVLKLRFAQCCCRAWYLKQCHCDRCPRIRHHDSIPVLHSGSGHSLFPGRSTTVRTAVRTCSWSSRKRCYDCHCHPRSHLGQYLQLISCRIVSNSVCRTPVSPSLLPRVLFTPSLVTEYCPCPDGLAASTRPANRATP